MSRAGNKPLRADRSAGFTLIEVLAVLVIISLTAAAISTMVRSPSSSAQVKTAALLAASRLRDLRSGAMTSGIEGVSVIDVEHRTMDFGNGNSPLIFSKGITIDVTAADREKLSPSRAGIRFYPNGSSTGGAIDMKSGGSAYEVRVNWLTGRVSASALQ